MKYVKGFTLIELLLVLAIMSVMATFVVPQATRSIHSLQMEQVCAHVIQTVHFAIDQAATTGQPIRLVVDTKHNSWYLEKSDHANSPHFIALDGFAGRVRGFGDRITAAHFEDFDIQADGRQSLVFNPTHDWPQASFELSDGEIHKRITIEGKAIAVEEIE